MQQMRTDCLVWTQCVSACLNEIHDPVFAPCPGAPKQTPQWAGWIMSDEPKRCVYVLQDIALSTDTSETIIAGAPDHLLPMQNALTSLNLRAPGWTALRLGPDGLKPFRQLQKLALHLPMRELPPELALLLHLRSVLRLSISPFERPHSALCTAPSTTHAVLDSFHWPCTDIGQSHWLRTDPAAVPAQALLKYSQSSRPRVYSILWCIFKMLMPCCSTSGLTLCAAPPSS